MKRNIVLFISHLFNKTAPKTRGKTYFSIFLLFVFLLLLTLPTGSGRMRRPSSLSSSLEKLSLPKGLPVYVLERNRLTSDSAMSTESSLRHCAGDVISYHRDRLNISQPAPSSTCTAALDQAYRQGLRHSRARTGFGSMYFMASQKRRSSRAQE